MPNSIGRRFYSSLSITRHCHIYVSPSKLLHLHSSVSQMTAIPFYRCSDRKPGVVTGSSPLTHLLCNPSANPVNPEYETDLDAATPEHPHCLGTVLSLLHSRKSQVVNLPPTRSPRLFQSNNQNNPNVTQIVTPLLKT